MVWRIAGLRHRGKWGAFRRRFGQARPDAGRRDVVPREADGDEARLGVVEGGRLALVAAGIIGRVSFVILYKPLAEVTEEEFDPLFAVNAKGTFFA